MQNVSSKYSGLYLTVFRHNEFIFLIRINWTNPSWPVRNVRKTKTQERWKRKHSCAILANRVPCTHGNFKTSFRTVFRRVTRFIVSIVAVRGANYAFFYFSYFLLSCTLVATRSGRSPYTHITRCLSLSPSRFFFFMYIKSVYIRAIKIGGRPNKNIPARPVAGRPPPRAKPLVVFRLRVFHINLPIWISPTATPVLSPAVERILNTFLPFRFAKNVPIASPPDRPTARPPARPPPAPRFARAKLHDRSILLCIKVYIFAGVCANRRNSRRWRSYIFIRVWLTSGLIKVVNNDCNNNENGLFRIPSVRTFYAKIIPSRVPIKRFYSPSLPPRRHQSNNNIVRNATKIRLYADE